MNILAQSLSLNKQNTELKVENGRLMRKNVALQQQLEASELDNKILLDKIKMLEKSLASRPL